MLEEIKKMTVWDYFAQTQETFEEAKKKSAEESSKKKAQYFKIAKDGTYAVRILPLAPVVNADGDILPPERKGYEYPTKELVLKIKNPSKPSKITYVNVCNAKYAFPDLEADLIDTYVKLACEVHSDDEKMCKKLKSNSFDGGLKWDSKRCLYVLDLDNRNDGIQILRLSYSQYKELEERKLNTWEKLQKTKRVFCPISSIGSAYPIEITRKTENTKVGYSYNIDTLSAPDSLSEGELNALMDAPRLPEVLYRYTRYHLEATIAFLKQKDSELGIDIMKEPEIEDCIDKIKLSLSSDDLSHFSFGDAKGDQSDKDKNDIDTLWTLYQQLEDEGLDDRSEEGQNLRASIREYIEENDLDIRVSRGKSNIDLLNEIEECVEETPSQSPKKSKETQKDESGEDDDTPASTPSFSEEEEDDDTQLERRRSRNDDTNEPAVLARRGTRPRDRR